jgi:hypothetical protein
MNNLKTFESFNNLSLIRGVGKNETGNMDLFGKGIYLTDDIDVAKFYGDTIKSYNIKGKIFDTTKEFNSIELRKFFNTLDGVLNSNVGTKYYYDIINNEYNTDYISISWMLDSDSDFQRLIIKNKLNTNDFYNGANVCTGMNLALQKMGYVGLKYSTSEIEDLDDRGLGDKNAYLIFDLNSIYK